MTLTTISILLAAIAVALGTLTIGFCAGFLCAVRSRAPLQSTISPSASTKPDEIVMDSRLRVATDSLVHLAHSMASNVAAHSTKIEQISSTFSQDTLEEAAIALIPGRILALNLELQSQLARAKQQIENQARELKVRESEARTDLLTSLYNRRAFDEEMRRQLADWGRHRRPFCLLMFDIDFFKRFNDQHGHQVGDVVLREVAQTIVGELRPMDLAYRFGGEEFAVLMPGTELENAAIAGDRIRMAIERSTYVHNNKNMDVTTSVGVTEVLSSDDGDSIIHRADRSLYKSKNAGRNCVFAHDGRHINRFSGVPNQVEQFGKNSMRGKSHVASAFSRELTTQVCKSRRDGTPLSILWLKYEHAAEEYDRTAESAFEIVLDQHLTSHDVSFLGSNGEAWLILPHRTMTDANELLSKLCADSHITGKSSELRCEETAEQLVERTRGELVAT